MKILVTGASGLLGKTIVQELVQHGYSVRLMVHSQPISNPSVEIVNGSITDSTFVLESVKGCTAVIHCAALISFWPKKFKSLMEVNVDGTKNLIDAMLFHQVPYLIHISSIAAIGRNKITPDITEEITWESSDQNSQYAISKHLAELEVFRGFEEGIKGVVLNPSILLGKGEKSSASVRFIDYATQSPLFYTNGKLHFVDVRDVSAVVLECLTKQLATGERYILNTDSISYKSFFDVLANKTHSKPPRWEAKSWMKEIVWRWEAIKSFFNQKEPLITRETARTADSTYIYDASKAKSTFSYPRYSLDQTLDFLLDKKE